MAKCIALAITILHRDIALKVLPQAIVVDPLRRQRFVREARAASALEHPHIAVIHEIGEDQGVTFIAMDAGARRNASTR